MSQQKLSTSDTINKILYLEAIAEKGSAEIRVNDLPFLFVNENNNQGFNYRPIEFDVLSGINTLSIIPSDSNSRIKARIVNYKSNDWIDGRGGETIIHTISSKGKTTSISGNIPLLKGRDLNYLNNDLLSKKDIKEAENIARQILGLLKSGKLKEYADMFEPKTNDKISKDRNKSIYNDIQELYKSRKEKNNWNLFDIDKVHVNYVFVGNNRLIDLRLNDGTTLFRTTENSKWEHVKFFRMLGKINGVWKIFLFS